MNNYQEAQNVGLEVLTNLYKKSWNSQEFKERLIENPFTTIEEIVGHSISVDNRYIVEDQSDPSVIYLNIPAKRNLESLELSDEQLEMVSGGDITLLGACIIVGGVALIAGVIGIGVGYAANKR